MALLTVGDAAKDDNDPDHFWHKSSLCLQLPELPFPITFGTSPTTT
jgi:hypothetical protein